MNIKFGDEIEPIEESTGKKVKIKIDFGNLSYLQKAFVSFCRLKRCIWCKKKFPEGIILKTPEKITTINAFTWFSADFLIHARTTHGLDPNRITDILKELGEEHKDEK